MGRRRFGLENIGRSQLDMLDYWARTQMGAQCVCLRPLWNCQREEWKAIVCGHSHLPGHIQQDDRSYINTGSWTFGSSQYAHWNGTEFSVADWISGRIYKDELYRPIINGSIDEKDFWQWWRENYMGFFRFREGEERQGRLRGWESHIRDYQYLARLEPLKSNSIFDESETGT